MKYMSLPTLNILVVEDNQDMRRNLSTFLDNRGMNVVQVASTEDAIDEVNEQNFDLGLVDINLPGKSGYDLIEYIREEGHEIPLIALTARDGIEDKLKGFDLGLTDYLIKPFDLQELWARIAAHTKDRSINDEEAVITTPHFSINPKRYEFTVDKKPVELTKLEFRIIHRLMRENHNIVTIDDLIESAWGEQSDMVNPPIRIHLANLRKKIGDTEFVIIRTIPGTGYVFSDPSGEKA